MDRRQEVFRRAMLERLTSPYELTEMVTVIRPLDWFILAMIAVLLSAGLAWSLIESLPVTLPGRGMIARIGAEMQVVAPVSGHVELVSVIAGETVESGATLVEFRPAPGYARRRQAQPLFAAHPDSNEAPLYHLVSPSRAKVLEVSVLPGDDVAAGALLITLHRTEEKLGAVLLVSELLANRVQPGFSVRLAPHSYSTQVYGYLVGTVSGILPSPMSDQGLHQLLLDDAQVRQCIDEGLRVRVDVVLAPDPSAPTYPLWSSGKRLDRPLQPRTELEGEVVLGYEHPIAWLLPRTAGQRGTQ